MSIVEELRRAGVAPRQLVALVVAPSGELEIAVTAVPPATVAPASPMAAPDGTPMAFTGVPSGLPALDMAGVELAEAQLRPRWVLWSNETAVLLVRHGIRVATCWDIAAVHRMLFGGWRAGAGRVWAELHGLAVSSVPTTAPPDLFSHADNGDGDPENPIRPDGHLRPDWVSGGWSTTPGRRGRWAELALVVARLQQHRLQELQHQAPAFIMAHSESAAELLCAELSLDGLPMDRAVAETVISRFVGSRARNEAEATEQRSRRDAEVLRHVPGAFGIDLRSPGQVKSLLSRVGVEVPDTRAWRLRAQQDRHPLVGAILAWRKAERVATTYGYQWLDEHLDPDGRLRGAWTGSDGAAGRMTASAGLHNMPAEMREAVVAEAGHVFVRADLGQVEPRVLAAISGDEQLARASRADDMYAPVAEQLAVDRATAKVAVLGAMYGQTTGRGAQALRRLNANYPVAMGYLERAARCGEAGQSLRTYGGRLIVVGSPSIAGRAGIAGPAKNEAFSVAAARGRYSRNAQVQGAAAELFKVWAVTVRARSARLDASIVLCLHDELLVQVPIAQGEATARLLEDCLQEAVRRWAPDDTVRFVADVSVVGRWSQAKASDEVATG